MSTETTKLNQCDLEGDLEAGCSSAILNQEESVMCSVCLIRFVQVKNWSIRNVLMES